MNTVLQFWMRYTELHSFHSLRNEKNKTKRCSIEPKQLLRFFIILNCLLLTNANETNFLQNCTHATLTIKPILPIMKLMSDWNNVLEMWNETAGLVSTQTQCWNGWLRIPSTTVNKKFKLVTCARHFVQKHEPGINLYCYRNVNNKTRRWKYFSF
jgi:hypothetical protein